MSKELDPCEQAYLQGFIDKCAEYGVDPAQLAQLAKLVETQDERGSVAGRVAKGVGGGVAGGIAGGIGGGVLGTVLAALLSSRGKLPPKAQKALWKAVRHGKLSVSGAINQGARIRGAGILPEVIGGGVPGIMGGSMAGAGLGAYLGARE